MTAYLLAAIPSRELDTGGNPVSGAKLHTWIAGTTTPLATFTDSTGGTPLPNPIVADVGGHYPQIWVGSAAYDLEARKADDATVLWQRLDVAAPEVVSDQLRADLATDLGSGLMGYIRGQVYQRGTIGFAIQHLLPNLVTDYGAAIDGTTDDTAAWQAALDAQVWFNVPPGVSMAHELHWRVGSRVYGAGCWSTNTSSDETTSTTVLRYNGAGGLNSYIALLSTAAIGVQPTTPLQNAACNGIHFDGMDLAEIGRMDWRAWAGNDLDNCSFGNCRKAGLVAINCWDKGPRANNFWRNRGPGFILGKDYFNLSITVTVDEVTLIDWFTYGNGCDQAGNPYNVFTDTGGTAPASTTQEAEAGGVVYGGRHLRFINLQSAQNSGPGVVLNTSFHPTRFDGGYMEANGRSSGVSRAWCTWIDLNAASFNIEVGYFFFGSPSPAHRITGTKVFRIEQTPLYHHCALLGEMVVDVGIPYRLDCCDRLVADGGTLVITGQAPTHFDRQNGPFRSLGISGKFRATTVAGVLSGFLKSGTCVGLVRTGAGAFTETHDETYTGGNYDVFPTALPSGWEMCETSRTSTTYSFTIEHAGVPTDPTFVFGAMVMGDY